jgi:hypothetical protein
MPESSAEGGETGIAEARNLIWKCCNYPLVRPFGCLKRGPKRRLKCVMRTQIKLRRKKRAQKIRRTTNNRIFRVQAGLLKSIKTKPSREDLEGFDRLLLGGLRNNQPRYMNINL